MKAIWNRCRAYMRKAKRVCIMVYWERYTSLKGWRCCGELVGACAAAVSGAESRSWLQSSRDIASLFGWPSIESIKSERDRMRQLTGKPRRAGLTDADEVIAGLSRAGELVQFRQDRHASKQFKTHRLRRVAAHRAHVRPTEQGGMTKTIGQSRAGKQHARLERRGWLLRPCLFNMVQ
jgi:hypothetical protein